MDQMQTTVSKKGFSTQERGQQSLNRWKFLIEQGRQELHLHQWFISSAYYQQAMLTAEALLTASPCKNCALRCYVRTLVEYAYIVYKTSDDESVDLLEQSAVVTLAGLIPMQMIEKLLKPLGEMKTLTDSERDIWINQLFSNEAMQYRNVH